MFIYNQNKFKDLRRKLRNGQTDAERKVWNILRSRKILDLRFLRQYGVKNYILDFYCPEIKLAIEVDGGQHNEEVEKLSDADRTRLMGLYGITVIRFWNNDVMGNLEGVHCKITEVVQGLKNNPS
jgi:very-short-patch-repair endonuclease